ncbi:MAG: hypothetical protein ETSY1_46750 (plasmid) [Candidatus Entotheonella factor]|uniref:Phage tail tape measure protein domain-containing protein n=1 Tax=Entotheonella factor TaxID=1429438 RepID=W4LZQ0_ENTF1|nr:MAG: hypothetical protein ETSY1_46750 [Candidatus Entotheonella factor]
MAGKGALDALQPSALKVTRDLWKMRAATLMQRAATVKLQAASMLSVSGLKGLALKAMPLVITGFKAMSLAALVSPVGLTIAGIAAGALLIIKFWTPIKGFFAGVWDGIKDSLGPNTLSVFRELGTVFGWLGSLVKGLITPADSGAQTMHTFKAAGFALGKVFMWLMTPLTTLVESVSWATKKIASLLDKLDLLSRGKKMMKTMGSGIKAGKDWVVGSVKSVFGEVGDHLPKSDAKIGPLSRLTHSGVQLVKTVGEGVDKGAARLTEPLARVLAQASPEAHSFAQARAPHGSQLAAFLGQAAAPAPLQPLAQGAAGGGIHIDMRGMTIQAQTKEDAEAIGSALEARIRKVVEDLGRRRQAGRRGALHDGDGAQLGSL